MGFVKEVLKEGSGAKPKRGNTVTVHCTGYGKNGDCELYFISLTDERISKGAL